MIKIIRLGLMLAMSVAVIVNAQSPKQIVRKQMNSFSFVTVDVSDDGPYVQLHSTYGNEQEDIYNEIFYGELEELAILVQAEAGNQDEYGKRLVADVVLNRVNSPYFPETIHEVIYQENPIQFSSVKDGNYEEACYTVTEEVFQIVYEEYLNISNTEVIYFRTQKYSSSGHPLFKHGAHYFSSLF